MKFAHKNLLVVIGLNFSSQETGWMRKEQWHLDLRAFHLKATVHGFIYSIGFCQKCISQCL